MKKIVTGIPRYEDLPIQKWTSFHLISYFLNKFYQCYGIRTRRPIGQIKIHINKKTISTLYSLEGKARNLYPTQLFKEFIDWNIERSTLQTMKIWYFSKQEHMADFLDERAKKVLEKEIGSLEDFKRQEEERLKETEEYFKNLGMDL